MIPRAEVPKAVAYLPGVRAAVALVRDKLAAEADAVFASHDRPGGHSITRRSEGPDGLVSLEGPAPLSVEFGHWTHPNQLGQRTYVQGIHALGRAVAAAEAL